MDELAADSTFIGVDCQKACETNVTTHASPFKPVPEPVYRGSKTRHSRPPSVLGVPMNLVLCNCPPEASEKLAEKVVSLKLAACVNISQSVQSIYFWDGALCKEREQTLTIKVSQDATPALVEVLQRNHPFDVPEILVLNVDANRSYEPYVRWVESTCDASK